MLALNVWEWTAQPFTDNAFMSRALFAGMLVAITCAVVGTFVVLRGLAFMGEAMGHGALPGIAVALLLGISGLLGAACGALVMILGVHVITRRSRLNSDTAIGLLFVGMLALGVAIVSSSDSFTGDLVRVLFGDILGVQTSDLSIQLGATAVILGVSAICARPFLLLAFDEELAQTSGFSVQFYHLVSLLTIGATVVTSFRTVGTMLVFGMLVGPAATASLMSRRVTTTMVTAAGIGCISMLLGLLASYHYDIAAGSAVVLVSITIFFTTFAVKNVVGGDL